MKQLFAVLLLSLAPFAGASGTELTAPQAQKFAEYGYAVSANGNTLAVINGQQLKTGTIYVYQPTTKNWGTATLVAQLRAADGAQFYSVAVYGNVIVAGAVGDNAVYGFIEPAKGWKNGTQSFTLTATDDNNALFGWSVAFSNKTIVVGAPTLGGGGGPAAVYVFTEPANGWASGTQTAELTPSIGSSSFFGYSVAVNGPVVVVGDTDGANAPGGQIFVYQENVGGWQDGTETAQLTDPDPQDPFQSGLGQSVAILGNSIVGGFSRLDVHSQPFVVLYNRPGNSWSSMSTPTAKLSTKEDLALTGFGYSLAFTNNFLLVGDPGAGLENHNPPGGVFVFAAPQGGWQHVVDATENEWIKPGAGGTNSQFGSSVAAFSTGALFIGAPGFTIDGDQNAGAVFIKNY